MSINSLAQDFFTGDRKVRKETLTPKSYNTDPLKVYARRRVEEIAEERRLKQLNDLESWF